MSFPCMIPSDVGEDLYKSEEEIDLCFVKMRADILHYPCLGLVWIVSGPRHRGLCRVDLNPG